MDDDESILRGYQLNLRKTLIFTLQKVERVESKFLKSRRFSVVLSDMRMPGMNGLEMLSEINKIDSDIVNIIITGTEILTWQKKLLIRVRFIRF